MTSSEILTLPPHVEHEPEVRNLNLTVLESIGESERFQILELIRVLESEVSPQEAPALAPRSEIYKAQDWLEGDQVAVKIFHEPSPQVSRVVDRELAAYALLHGQPGIVEVRDMGQLEKDGFTHRYVAFENAEAGNLMDYLDAAPRTLDIVINSAVQIAEGLEVTHAQGLVHNDIKPENTLVITHPDGTRYKLTDFELVEAFRPPAASDPLATLGSVELWQGSSHGPRTIVGTPGYIAPENILDPENAGPEADVFALGVTAFNAATGVLPFTSKTLAAYFDSVSRDRPASAKECNRAIPAQLSDLINECLRYFPCDRPTSSEARARILELIQGDLSDVILEPIKALPEPKRPSSRVGWRPQHLTKTTDIRLVGQPTQELPAGYVTMAA